MAGTPAPSGTVLVVDDDPAILDFVATALEDQGYTVVCAVDGAALGVARERQPDVILLDILMPGMDGVEVSQRMRADPATARIPIIAMSAQERLHATSSLMPVNDRLPKPFELMGLYTTVARWAQTT
jgi:CheY-like chemotaxis protein